LSYRYIHSSYIISLFGIFYPVTYIQILLLVYFFFLFLNSKLKIIVYHKPTHALFISLIFLALGYLWDSYAVSQGHWLFNSEKLINIKISNLPIEEYLFFIIIPYCSISLHKTIYQQFINKKH